MEEKLFWISMVSGVFAFVFHRALRSEAVVKNHARVFLLNGFFWAFVGVAAGFLISSYKELGSMSVPVGVACAVAGGLLGLLWVLPVHAGFPGFLSLLWALQGMAFASGLGSLLAVPRVSLGWAVVGLGALGAVAGVVLRQGESVRLFVPGLMGIQGVVAGYWFANVGPVAGSLWTMPIFAVLGFLLGNGWKPRLIWSPEANFGHLKDTKEWADTGFSAILLAAAIMYFVVQAFKIPSASMQSTLMIGDHLFVNKFIYGVHVPLKETRVFPIRHVTRGDILVFRFPTESQQSSYYGKDFIKRAVGLPGDVVEIKDKQIYVNGTPLAQPHAQFEDDSIIPGPFSGALVPDESLSRLQDPLEFQKVWESGCLSPSEAERFRDNFGPITVPAGTYFVMGDNRDRSYDSRFWGPMPDKNLKGCAWILYWPFSRWKIIR